MSFELIMLLLMLATIVTGIATSVACVLILLDAGDDFAGDSSKRV
jgi:hypothetical protein